MCFGIILLRFWVSKGNRCLDQDGLFGREITLTGKRQRLINRRGDKEVNKSSIEYMAILFCMI